jgi:uncharacterized protein YjbJ (UPF0337 family)
MSIIDTTKNITLNISGRVKEVAGVATKNRDLETQGQVDQITANVRRAREQGVGALKSLRNALHV